MKKENSVLHATIAGILAAGTAMAATNVYAVPEQPKNWENVLVSPRPA